jgi:hypothetical protein
MDSTENPLRTLINKKNYNIVIFLKNLYFQTIIVVTHFWVPPTKIKIYSQKKLEK